jgi:hypothetical protein
MARRERSGGSRSLAPLRGIRAAASYRAGRENRDGTQSSYDPSSARLRHFNLLLPLHASSPWTTFAAVRYRSFRPRCGPSGSMPARDGVTQRAVNRQRRCVRTTRRNRARCLESVRRARPGCRFAAAEDWCVRASRLSLAHDGLVRRPGRCCHSTDPCRRDLEVRPVRSLACVPVGTSRGRAAASAVPRRRRRSRGHSLRRGGHLPP